VVGELGISVSVLSRLQVDKGGQSFNSRHGQVLFPV